MAPRRRTVAPRRGGTEARSRPESRSSIPAPATSSASRRRGPVNDMRWRGSWTSTIGVRMPSGSRHATDTEVFRSSAAAATLNARTPCFAAEYAARCGTGAQPARDATLRIRPPPEASMVVAAARVRGSRRAGSPSPRRSPSASRRPDVSPCRSAPRCSPTPAAAPPRQRSAVGGVGHVEARSGYRSGRRAHHRTPRA